MIRTNTRLSKYPKIPQGQPHLSTGTDVEGDAVSRSSCYVGKVGTALTGAGQCPNVDSLKQLWHIMSKNAPCADTLDGIIISETLAFASRNSLLNCLSMTHSNKLKAYPNTLDLLLKVAYFYLLRPAITSICKSCICHV